MTLRPTRSRFRLEVGEGKAADIADLWARADRDAMTRTRARYFGYVLQTGGLLPFLDIYENVVISRRAARPSLPWTGAGDPGVSGIGHLARRMPARVSIGERQRAAARARSPTDRRSCSPTSPPRRSTRQAPAGDGALRRLAAELAITLVVVSHDRHWSSACDCGRSNAPSRTA